MAEVVADRSQEAESQKVRSDLKRGRWREGLGRKQFKGGARRTLTVQSGKWTFERRNWNRRERKKREVVVLSFPFL